MGLNYHNLKKHRRNFLDITGKMSLSLVTLVSSFFNLNFSLSHGANFPLQGNASSIDPFSLYFFIQSLSVLLSIPKSLAILLADCPVSFTNFIASNLYHNKPS
nr:hypothetical protein [Wolbachia pipientis]